MATPLFRSTRVVLLLFALLGAVSGDAIAAADMGKVLVERPRLRRHSGRSEPSKGYHKQMRKWLACDETSWRCTSAREPVARTRGADTAGVAVAAAVAPPTPTMT